MTVVSLEFTPPPRFDELPWTRFEIQEAADVNGAPGTFTVIDTKTWTPADSDPENPATRSFTTEAAALDSGWYRGVWIDADDDRSSPTEPVHNIAPLVDVGRVMAAIESRMAHRLRIGGFTEAGGGRMVEHFQDDPPTRPTRSRALEVAVREAYAIGRDYPAALAADGDDLVTVAALRGAIELEGSSYPDQVETGRSPARFWRDLLNDRLRRLDSRLRPSEPGLMPPTGIRLV